MERIGQRFTYAKGGITKWYWDYRDRAVLRHTEGAKRLIDVGCGEGITLEKVFEQSRNRTILGIDIDFRNVVACRHLPVIEGDVYGLSGGSWDCCLFLDVVEHLTEPRNALHHIHEALLPGGKLVIMFPNDFLWFFARLAFLKCGEAFNDYGHLWRFSPGGMSKLLRDTAFSVESIEKLPCKLFPLHYLIVARKA